MRILKILLKVRDASGLSAYLGFLSYMDVEN